MNKSINENRKNKRKLGRPVTTGPGQLIGVRMHEHQIAAIRAWIARRGEEISLPEALRRLALAGASLEDWRV